MVKKKRDAFVSDTSDSNSSDLESVSFSMFIVFNPIKDYRIYF